MQTSLYKKIDQPKKKHMHELVSVKQQATVKKYCTTNNIQIVIHHRLACLKDKNHQIDDYFLD